MATPREHIHVLPNAKGASERLDFQHQLLTPTFGGLNLSPLDQFKLHRVLDIGCGAGNWASDFAKQHPNIEVIDFDIGHKPDLKTRPSDFTFKVADLGDESAWSELGKLNYIHGRLIVPSVPRLAQFAEAFLRAFQSRRLG